MTHYFFDSSALIKRYHPEKGSDKVNKIMDSEDYLMISSVGMVEFCSAINRKKNQRKITQEDFEFAIWQFFNDVRTRFFVVGLEGYRIAIANDMVFKHNITSFDAVQLASCIHVGISGDIVFVSADKDLLEAAKSEGLKVLNPEE